MGVDTSLNFDGAFTTGEASGSVPRPAPQPAEHVGKSATGTYVVQSGDTLSGIAEKYNTTWQNLAAINSLGNPNLLQVEQVLKVTDNASSQNTYYVQ